MNGRRSVAQAVVVLSAVVAVFSWSPPTLGVVVELEQEDLLGGVAVSADDELRYVVSGGDVLLVDADGAEVRTLPISAWGGLDVDDGLIAVGDGRTVSVLDLNGNTLASVELSRQVSDVAISNSTLIVGTRVANSVGDGDARVEMFALDSLAPLGDLLPRNLERVGVWFGTHGNRLVVGTLTRDEPGSLDWPAFHREVVVFDDLELSDTFTLVSNDTSFAPEIYVIAPGPHGTLFATGWDEDEGREFVSVYDETGSLEHHIWAVPYDNFISGMDTDACSGLVGVASHHFTSSHDWYDGPYTGFKYIPDNRDPGCFLDVLDSQFAAAVSWLGTEHITRGCNPPMRDRYCPDDYVTRGQMAALISRALNYTDDGGGGFFSDTVGHTFETSIDRLRTVGVTKGCNPPTNTNYCPNDFVTRGQMAAFLVRALGYTDNGGGDLFADDDGHVFEPAIDKLAAAGVTKGCNPPINDRFCPNDLVTRGQLAAFLKRALTD